MYLNFSEFFFYDQKNLEEWNDKKVMVELVGVNSKIRYL